MLVNQNGQQVKLSDKLTTKTHPQIFANLREVKEPENFKGNKLFSMEQRAKFKV